MEMFLIGLILAIQLGIISLILLLDFKSKKHCDELKRSNVVLKNDLETIISRSYSDLRANLETVANRIEESPMRKPQAEKWNSLKEAFKAPIKSVEINERSGTF